MTDLSQLVDKRAETMVLGSMLLKPEIADEVAFLRPEEFYGRHNAAIFTALQAMRQRQDAIDYVTLYTYLVAHGTRDVTLEEVGRLTDDVMTTAGAQNFAAVVREKFKARALHMVLGDLCHRIEQGLTSDEVISEMLDATSIGGDSKFSRASLQGCVDKIERYQDGKAQAYTLTGIHELDRYPAGANELCIIAGRPSMGKSALGIFMAERIAMLGNPVLFISIEMAGDDCNMRRLGNLSRVPLERMKRPGMSSVEWDHVHRAFAAMRGAPLEILSGRFSLSDLVVALRREKQVRGIKAAFVDHLGCMILPEAERHDLKLGIVTSTLSRLAKDLDITIYLLHQLNRASEKRGDDKRPFLSDLRNSGEIEQDADCVWLIYRERYYDSKAGREFDINCAKNRNGPVGQMKMYFDETTGRFEELEREEQQQRQQQIV